jgi:hypothetical protein
MTPDPHTTTPSAESRVQLVPHAGAEPSAAGATLEHVVKRLERFADPSMAINSAEISTWVHAAGAQFATAPIQAFVPILVEHIVRGQITARRRDVQASR